ncbi:MAG: type III pantothenate kinase [Eubacteriales bacterium]|nr:type III pantothenate kinase [Eubacteriales bacterium]
MLLATDVSNTNITFGLFSKNEIICKWKMATDKENTSDEFCAFFFSMFSLEKIRMDSVSNVIVASVVPTVMYSLQHSMRKTFGVEPLIVNPGLKTGVNIKYENPREIGADRIVNAAAACEIYGAPLIIADLGTATVYCAISPACEYIGGVICPGIKISAEALFQKTAKLPKVDIAKPESVIGKNTVASIQSGLVYGFAGQTDYIVRKIKSEMCRDYPGLTPEKIRVIATGGLARLIAGEAETIDTVDTELTLKGLKIVFDRNRIQRV